MFNIEERGALINYLRRQGHIGEREKVASRALTGGVSNRTVWVERSNGESWVLKQALSKLRVEVDWFSDPSRVHREAAGIRWLNHVLPVDQIPQLVFEDHEQQVIAMTAVSEPHENWKQMLLGGKLNPEHVEQFARLLGQIHRRGFETRASTAIEFSDDSFFEALRLEPYYAYTATQVPAAAKFIHTVIDETRQHKLTVVHGDFSPKNVLVHRGRLVLLDHEVIHFGDPAFDLGFSLTHFLSKAHHLYPLRGEFTKAAVAYWRTYQQTLGDIPWTDGLEDRAVHNTLACLLARVAGRSPFEYLDSNEKQRQRQAVLSLMEDPPDRIERLAVRFVDGLTNSV